MTTEEIWTVIVRYRIFFEINNFSKKKFPEDQPPLIREDAFSHCYAMLDEMEQFLAVGEIDKTLHWLGFIQGVLWDKKVFTLDKLKGHNKS